MPTPKDQILYEKIKQNIHSKYKPSAYRSGLLVKEYKREYLKKYKNDDAYIGNRQASNLKKWFDEEWKNQRGKVGYEKTGDIYRPTIKINEKTPTTWFELTPAQIKAAQNEKKNFKRVKNFAKL